VLQGKPSSSTPLAVTKVVGRRAELGTTVITFDRDVSTLLSAPDKPYAAYRITDTAGSARRLTKVLKFGSDPGTFSIPDGTSGSDFYDNDPAVSAGSLVLDAVIDDLSAGQLVAVVDWALPGGTAGCDIAAIHTHTPIHWEAAPGAVTRVSQVNFDPDLGTLSNATSIGHPVTLYVLDQREVARHYVFPASPPASAPASIRLYPAPAAGAEPPRVSVDIGPGNGEPIWQLLEVSPSLLQEAAGSTGADAPVGLIVDFAGPAPVFDQPGGFERARASANVVPVHHGVTTKAVLGSGSATAAGQRLSTPDAPVAYDLDAAAEVVPTMVVRVDGVAWPEVPTLYGAGPVPGFVAELGADGGVTAVFGDGGQGLRLPTGRNNVAASYRLGGGSEGEVDSGAINALVGSVPGVKKVRGAGPTSGGADQDDERRIRTLVPARARAFGRVVSLDDLADLALAYPGVTHAAAWRGAGPPGCACGGVGLHVAALRRGTDGRPRPPLAAEIISLGTYLDGRRDVSVPLCVGAGTATTLGLSATVVVDPNRVAMQVAETAVTALADPEGPLDPAARRQGQALDRSDILVVIHQVIGVVGVSDLVVTGATITPGSGDAELGRQPAQRWELLLLPATPNLAGVSA
jgi:hypothetical protein